MVERAAALDAINVSIEFDKRLWREDLDGSEAHVRMLGAQGIVEAEDVDAILGGLGIIRAELADGTFPFRDEFEDIHLNVEARLTELIGDTGKKLHTGRSRNDQVATDLRLFVLREGVALEADIVEMANALLFTAERELDALTIMPFYTHLQRAQPVLLAHHLLAHAEALERDRGRLRDALKRTNQSPLGAAAGAGSGYAIDPHLCAKGLGFREPCRNSLDAVGSRDFCLELLSALSILMVNLSRIAQELILWSSSEFGFCHLSDRVTTGSSIMPQKRNPDGAELVRGKTGRVIGRLMGLLTTVKALPLAYNKDLQEDKEAIFDAVDTTRLALRVLTITLHEATFNRERMREAVDDRRGYANATELADYLTQRGLPFREAYHKVKDLVREADGQGLKLEELPLSRLEELGPGVDVSVLDYLAVDAAVERRSAFMGTAPERVREALEAAQQRWWGEEA